MVYALSARYGRYKAQRGESFISDPEAFMADCLVHIDCDIRMKDKLESAAVIILMVLILGPMIGAAFAVSIYMGVAMLGVLILGIFRRRKT